MNYLSLGLVCALALPMVGCSGDSQSAVTKEVYAMDTVMNFTAYGDQGAAALDAIESTVIGLENDLSRTRDTSQISQLNQNGTAALTDDVAALLSLALDYSHATQGTFNPTVAPVMDAWGFTTEEPHVPDEDTLTAALSLVDNQAVTMDGTTATLEPGMAVDLGGIAKGYAGQLVADIFAEYEIVHGMASLGGNVYVCGGKLDDTPWRVGVQDPFDTSALAGVLSLSDGFAVTSGAYQRNFQEDGQTYHHIIDPATGYSAQSGLSSVTIISPDDGTLCDALSTALYVMGEAAAADFWRSGVYEFEMILITDDGRILVSQGLEGQFEAKEPYTYALIS